jgi:uncharacterized protein (TIGR01777 family)
LQKHCVKKSEENGIKYRYTTLMLKIAITGSTGLLGSALSQSLSNKQHTIIPVKRYRDENNPWIDYAIKQGDLSLLENCDALIHLVGAPVAQIPLTTKAQREIYSSRIDFTAILIEELKKLSNPPRLFISASAIGGYGTKRGDVDETSPLSNEGFLAKVVSDWEHTASQATELAERVVFLRTGHVLTRSGGYLKYTSLPFKLHVGVIFGSGSNWISWIHINDWVHAVNFILENSAIRGPVNMVSPNPVPFNEIATELARVYRSVLTIKFPETLLKLMLGSITSKELLLSSQKVHPKVLLEQDFNFNFTQIASALQDLITH